MWNPPNFGDLPEHDPTKFEFISDGGLKYIGDKRSVLISMASVSKAHAFLNDDELTNFAHEIQNYADSINGIDKSALSKTKILYKESFEEIKPVYLYKFCSKYAYENYISRGIFLLSSLVRYRKMELDGSPAGDRCEG